MMSLSVWNTKNFLSHCMRFRKQSKLSIGVLFNKAKAYNTCIAPQATYHSCSGAVRVTDSGRTAYMP